MQRLQREVVVRIDHVQLQQIPSLHSLVFNIFIILSTQPDDKDAMAVGKDGALPAPGVADEVPAIGVAGGGLDGEKDGGGGVGETCIHIPGD